MNIVLINYHMNKQNRIHRNYTREITCYWLGYLLIIW